jgi:hypothetical protein
MNQAEAERHLAAIETVLSSAGYLAEDRPRYARFEIEEKSSDYRVYYRNADKEFWWELTDAKPELAAPAIRRWDSSADRALRD